MAERRFRKTFNDALNVARVQESRQVFADQLVQRKLGHPEFEKLAVMQTARSKAVVMFLDIRGFTKLSFVRENEELLRIIQAMTVASIESIAEAGGFVGEFTGDGVMAYFGDSKTPDEDAALSAFRSASGLMTDVKEFVNPLLSKNGSDPIRVAVGMESGPVLWSRIGSEAASQVKAISDVTFLAGKLATSRYTDAWECKIGERLAGWIQDDFKMKTEAYKFQFEGRQVSHELYLFDWRKFNQEEMADQPDQLRRRLFQVRRAPAVIGTTKVVAPDQAGRSGPRPLKDQPFF